MKIDIPGITRNTEQIFTILPGVPMYIDGKITDTTIDFSLRDRYGNLSSENLTGTARKNQDGAITPIAFTDGKLSLPRSPGYWRVDVPSISSNSISYIDDINTDT
jgi:hypothetical protein